MVIFLDLSSAFAVAGAFRPEPEFRLCEQARSSSTQACSAVLLSGTVLRCVVDAWRTAAFGCLTSHSQQLTTEICVVIRIMS